MPAGRDSEDRGLVGQGAPERSLAPAVFQPVSSMLTTDAALICCSSRVCGAASASPARWMIAHYHPVANSTPNSSRASSVVSRRETRFLTASVTIAACSRGPNAAPDTPAGSSALVWAAHSGQHTRCSRYSVTLTAIDGSSATWCRAGSDTSMRSRSPNACAHDRQRPGQCSITSSTCSGASNSRCLPSCPSWPPRPRPDPFPRGRGGVDGGSCDGGSDEFRELRLSRRSSSPTRASSRRTPRPTRPTPTTTPQPSRAHRQGSLPPQPAPHPKIRRLHTGPSTG
jgi:hypothetical protein